MSDPRLSRPLFQPAPDATVLVGEAPGPNTRPDFPLFPIPDRSAGGRLRALSGLYMSDYFYSFERMNTLRDYPPGGGFPMKLARPAALSILPRLAGRRVVFVGKRVAEAFEFDAPWFEWRHFQPPTSPEGSFEAAVIPHTSGLNKIYNDPEVVKQARRFLAPLGRKRG